jgi:DNA-binding transcriptional LysR family regulator
MDANRLGDITAFVTAVKAGSFTAAAETLGVTRSAIGKGVARLEGSLGVRLLNRTTRTLSPTDEGRLVFERYRQILEDLDEVDASMAQRRASPSGILRLTAPLSFGQRHILPLLDVYLKQWPALRADISFTDRFVDLVEDGLDIAIRIGMMDDDSRLLAKTIAWQQFVTCASPDYLGRRGTPCEPAELEAHDRIVLGNARRFRPWHFNGPQGPLRIDRPARLYIDSSEALRAAALGGFGLVNLPTYIVGPDIHAGSLAEVLAGYRCRPEPIRLIYPSRRHLSPRVRAFIDLVAERWSAGVPWEAFDLPIGAAQDRMRGR